MFKDVLSIAGKPGLYKLISQSKNYVIVESLIDGKRQPSYSHEKISMLKDIAMFSENGEKHLGDLFKIAFDKENGSKIEIDTKNTSTMQEYFAQILPDYDKERIYPNDIKKFVVWYNVLIDAKITDFEIGKEENEEKTEEGKTKDESRSNKQENKVGKAVEKQMKKVSTKSVAAKQSTRVAVKKGS